MSQHSKREQEGPPAGSIAAGAVLTATAIGATAWTATGEVTGQTITGSLLGVALSALLLAQTLSRVVARIEAREKAAGRAERERREIAERAANTATWYGPGAGQLLTVRWDAVLGRFWVRGWLDRDWVVKRETRWGDGTSLIEMISRAEASGFLTPSPDDGTAAVRRRLGLNAAYPWEQAGTLEGADPFRAWIRDTTAVVRANLDSEVSADPVATHPFGEGWPEPADGESARVKLPMPVPAPAHRDAQTLLIETFAETLSAAQQAAQDRP